ncbi:MAG: S8 family serine peptidase [Armatimonadetes bacterium]|nr:S8 family serine peptidase [Armatimonadota bacterium]
MKFSWASLVTCLGAAFFSASASAGVFPWTKQSNIVPGKLLVKFAPGTRQLASRIARAGLIPGGTMRSRIGETGWTVWTMNPKADPDFVAKTLRRTPGVINVEPVHRIHTLLTTPNDPDYGVFEDDPECYFILDPDDQFDMFERTWHLIDNNAFSAWSQYPNTWYTAANKPQETPLVAVVDSGCDMNHPDFMGAGGSTTNSAGGGQLSHALSGKLRFGEFTQGPAQDENGHGTHVAGIALAAGNNGSFNGHGTIGMGYNATGMILNIIGADGSGEDSDAAAAIIKAADEGAEVINLSIGTEERSSALQDAVTYAFQKGSLVVGAANEAATPPGTLPRNYPAGCSGAFAVTSAAYGHLAPVSYCTTGNYFDMAAPGGDLMSDSYGNFLFVNVWSTMPLDNFALEGYPNYLPPIKAQYSSLIGTSMATPNVSGAAALYYGKNGMTQVSGWGNVKAMQALHQSGDSPSTSGMWTATEGFGYLDADALLSGVPTKPLVAGSIEGQVYIGGTAAANARMTAVKGATTITTDANPTGAYRFGSMLPGTWTVTAQYSTFTKVRKIVVLPGCEMPGVDFWANGNPYDVTVPSIARFQLASAPTATSVSVRHWAYDTETGVDKLMVRVGTAPGGTNIKVDTEVVISGDTFTLPTGTMSAGTTYYMRGTYTNGAGVTAYYDMPFQIGGTLRTISGKIQLLDWQKNLNGRIGEIQVRPAGGAAVEWHPCVIDRFGNYKVTTNRAGNLDVAYKYWHWISKKRNVGTATTVTGQDLSPMNGDCNGDNVVDLTDYTTLLVAFNATPESANWDVNADLNGDGVVDLTDYTIIVTNFNLIGE